MGGEGVQSVGGEGNTFVEWVVKSTEDYNRKFTCSTRS